MTSVTPLPTDTVLTCGHHVPAFRDGIGTGYATDPTTGARYCYPCADDHQREAMRTSPEFTVYVSGDGRELTTWTGGTLARVMWHTVSRSGFHGSEVHAYRARTDDGAEWYGRNGGPGMVITVRRAKTSHA